MEDNVRYALLGIAVVLIVGAIFVLQNPLAPDETVFPDAPTENETGNDVPSPYPLAPEIIGIHDWINSEPLKLADLRGKVVLVDFWTYSCINCLRTLPHLKEWNEKYSDKGFVLIGVHSPEFDFEKKLVNVRQAVEENGLKYPVALDSDMATWKNYKNRFWPAKYLVDADGRIRYTHFGEGAYAETEAQIQLLLEEANNEKIDIAISDETDSGIGAGVFRTRELYAGYARPGYIGNKETIVLEQVNEFTDPQNHLDGLIYLHGQWLNSAEFVKHARTTENLEDYIVINYLASEVNVVLGAAEKPYKVFVELDGKKLADRYAGSDIKFDEGGNAFFEVTTDKLYNVINGPIGKRELKLSSNSPDFTLYTFTFGG